MLRIRLSEGTIGQLVMGRKYNLSDTSTLTNKTIAKTIALSFTVLTKMEKETLAMSTQAF